MRKSAPARCYLSGEEGNLELVEFIEWVHPNVKAKIDKFFAKLKKRKTRYHSIEAWKNAHKL